MLIIQGYPDSLAAADQNCTAFIIINVEKIL